MLKLKLKTPSPAKQRGSGGQQSPTPTSNKSSSSKKSEAFANKWLFRFSELNQELEAAKQETQPTEDEPFKEDDSHLRQLQAVEHTQDHLKVFDEESTRIRLTSNAYKNKPIQANPFLIAEDMREFVFSFLDHWQRIRCEGWHGLPKHAMFMREFVRKINQLLRDNKELKAPPGWKRAEGPKKGPAKGSGGKKKGGKKTEKEDSDDDYA